MNINGYTKLEIIQKPRYERVEKYIHRYKTLQKEDRFYVSIPKNKKVLPTMPNKTFPDLEEAKAYKSYVVSAPLPVEIKRIKKIDKKDERISTLMTNNNKLQEAINTKDIVIKQLRYEIKRLNDTRTFNIRFDIANCVLLVLLGIYICFYLVK